MIEQYRRIKAKHRDAILFFRLGDFYEMFNEDAIEASSILDLTLTKRQSQPMCGIPYHAAKSYIARLLKSGKKVAICEQKSTPGHRGLMDREVVEVITPGTVVEDDFLEQGANNYLADLCLYHEQLFIAYIDVSTGEFKTYSLGQNSRAVEALRTELYRLSPRELLIQQSLFDNESFRLIFHESGALIQRQPDWAYDLSHAVDFLKHHFGVISLKGFGFEDTDPALAAAGHLLEYVYETIHQHCPHIRQLARFEPSEFVSLDEATRRNLEIVKNLTDSSKRDTLLEVIDRTRTAGGARLLRQWLLQPLRARTVIEARHAAVEFLYRNQVLLQDARKLLSSVLDSERLISRIAVDKAHAKDLRALHDSLEAGLTLIELLRGTDAPRGILPDISDIAEITCRNAAARIEEAIQEEPSILLTEGNIIKDGYSQELDELRTLHRDAQSVLARYLEEERERTGIQNLRIRYNRIIGYYLEVTKGNLESVPPHFIRRQSLVGAERYTTDQLADLESRINGAQERIVELEKALFLKLRESLKPSIPAFLEWSRIISEIDCLMSFAQTATEHGYVRPEMCDEHVIEITNGRHPVVEVCLPYGDFVPNSISLSSDHEWFALITGPNMAGKSTVLRQTALIVLLAHAGSFVPAETARIGIVDKIFCRVGAQDNLARGESTFLVEMHETAFILNTATAQSLVIMDEVGRGTGTLDGVAIAWAVSEYLLSKIRCRTLFATHYHELTTMGLPGMCNMRMAVHEHEGSISFPKRLEKGASGGSYGIHVARLAGLPEPVVIRASDIEAHFKKFEKDLSFAGAESASTHVSLNGSSIIKIDSAKAQDNMPERQISDSRVPQGPLELFSQEDLVLSMIRSIDPDRITPLKALQIIAEMVALLKR